MPEVREHIRWIHDNLPNLPIQVDGGIDRQTAPLVVKDGVTRLVTGNAFFQAPDQAGFIRDLSAL
jgi:ribulose-phosphate 3-epimerase